MCQSRPYRLSVSPCEGEGLPALASTIPLVAATPGMLPSNSSARLSTVRLVLATHPSRCDHRDPVRPWFCRSLARPQVGSGCSLVHGCAGRTCSRVVQHGYSTRNGTPDRLLCRVCSEGAVATVDPQTRS